MRTSSVLSQVTSLLITVIFSTVMMTACGSGSSFSGGTEKAEGKKPQAAQKADATPVKKPTNEKEEPKEETKEE